MRFKHLNCVGEIDNLPGCSQVAVFHSVFVPPKLRGHKFGSVAHKERLNTATELGYNYVLCTVDISNQYEIIILEKNGWKKLDTFTSDKTGHVVALYGKHINE